MVFQKAVVPPLWLPHRCDVDSSWNNNIDEQNQEDGEGKFQGNTKTHFSKAHFSSFIAKLLKNPAVLKFTFTTDTVSVSVCMNVYFTKRGLGVF